MPTAAPSFKPPGHRTHKQRRDAADKRRGSAWKRGYDKAWQALRLEFMAEHPYCECDEHMGKDGRALTEVVDHRKSIEERPDLRLEWTNLRAMTKTCHDRHTVRTQGFAQKRKSGDG